jgi:hypothetical protein
MKQETAEEKRLEESRKEKEPWKFWGPYLSERQWGTVREDYSKSGNAWDYFDHDQARSRAYRWGEDGLGASHQTGWTGLVARLIHLYAYLDPHDILEGKGILTYKEPAGARR